ncbi:putative ribonuclease H-like domain-containing protein [Tanacetum coccineum]|uniref:Ribonuclease H-like domain-containing protein n=1 Tax=Tanacetum coccineum TaxID=301880 RepID=A0ABQ4YF19_9ASTR
MTKNLVEHGLFSSVQQRTNHKDFQNCLFACFLSQEEPKKVIHALKDPSWIEAMQEELLQFKLQEVWTLVELPNGKRAIGTKWVFRNKKDERGIVIKNKARLVAQGYTQEESIDYDEVFSPVARIEAIRLFLAYVSFKDFVVYQMDVKSAFLYGKIEEEVYVCQPPGFEDPNFPDRVYKVEKALYGLHQAPRAWYETLSTYLLDNGFQRGKIDKALFIRRDKGDILLVQVYVDDIIFGSIKKSLCTEFEKIMHKKFQMSSIGELTFFLGLQVKQKNDGIFISQDKYVTEILKKFGFTDVKTASTPIETQKLLLKDEDGNSKAFQIKTWDDIQAKIEADQLLAERLQAREQEELTIEERAILFQQLLEKRRKHFAAKRAEKKGSNHQQKLNKENLFDKVMKRVNTFVDMDTELVKESSEKADAEIAQESSSKRAGDELEQESIKKQKVDEDKETTKLKSLMEVIPDEEEVEVDAIPLATKPPSIVDWKIHKEGRKSYYQIIRADGSSKMYLVFRHMLKSFDREDLETLYKLVKAKYGSTRPVEDLDLVLYGDLKTMFDLHVEDQERIVAIKIHLDDLRVTAAKEEAMEASKRRRIKLVYRIQQHSKSSSEGSSIIPEVPNEPKDNSGNSRISLFRSDDEVQDVPSDEKNKVDENKADANDAEKQA